jgi:hypothetical protein
MKDKRTDLKDKRRRQPEHLEPRRRRERCEQSEMEEGKTQTAKRP